MIFAAVGVVYNPGLAVRRKQALHTGLERNPEEVAVPIVVRKVAVEAVHMGLLPILRMEVDHCCSYGGCWAVRVVHMEVEAAHTEIEVAVPNLAVAVGLDHKTWINPSRRIFIISHCTIQGNVQYHTTGVKANRQVSISVYQE